MKLKSGASELISPRVASALLTTFSSGSRNGRHYDEDLIITERERERDGGHRRRNEDHTPRRRRSPSFDARNRAPYSSRDELDIAEEADYYNSRAAERSYLGEGYHGANKDWAIVDVPPGTKRVELEGIGGAREEITWQRYNGVRRSKFVAEGDAEYRGGGELMAPREVEQMGPGRRYVGEKDKKEKMWTEITKDLVTEDAIKHMGYDFEETEFFYYIMSYLKYVSLFLPFYPSLSFSPTLFSLSSETQPLTHAKTGGRPSPRRSLRRPQTRPPRTHPRNRMGATPCPAAQTSSRA